MLLQATPQWNLPAARACTAAEVAALLTPVSVDAEPVRLNCRARLQADQRVTRRLLFEGAEASGAGIDCGGGSLGRPDQVTTGDTPTVAIWSRRSAEGLPPSWSRPTDVTVSNCTVYGAVRVWGMGARSRYDDLRMSSRTTGHVANTQGAAPSHIRLDRVTFIATGAIPLYLGPGVTEIGVSTSRFRGRSEATAVYLDAESGRVTLTDNDFDIRTGREQIAVDGSAHNRITGNRFVLNGRGGIFLYRNCGERGVVRHQTPSYNRISDNVFTGAARLRSRTVVVNARQGGRSYCGEDRGVAFGSSIDDRDNAVGNIVADNVIQP